MTTENGGRRMPEPTTCLVPAECCEHGGRCAGLTHHAYGCHLDGDEKPVPPPPPASWFCDVGMHHWSEPRGVEVRGMRVTLVQTCVRERCRAARAEVW